MEQTIATNTYIKAILGGDPAQLREIYRSLFPMVRQLVKNNRGTDDDARDIFQEALFTIHDKASQPGFQLSSKFSSYLYGVSRNLWRNQLKKKYRQDVTILDEVTYMDDAQLDIDFEATERRKLYERYFDRLEEKCRRVLTLYFQGKSMQEIADVEKISEVNARQQKSRCQKHLIESIQKDPLYRELRMEN
ncbi:MAG: sigma-70 family RNA polymerase sigma factor [Lewinellaceae bacterium]|nr:sigma-70 family RNA polymerase sigma factor [Saprospiraceae bacterium]MCB9339545.1 sigma-70 family RNA polymerase sigma factor [Lewinellaceae bacterium]